MTIKIKRRVKIKRREKKLNCKIIINGNYWDKIKGGENTCYVCDKKIRPAQQKTYIGLHKYSGEKLFRHAYCEAGSSNWMEKFGCRHLPEIKSKGENL